MSDRNHFFSGMVLATAMAAACCCPGALPAATVVWDFEGPDFSTARADGATATMTLFDHDPDATEKIAQATSFGLTGLAGAPPNMSDGPANYLYHGPLPNYGHCGYAIDHSGFQATTADGRMGAWTMVFDLYMPSPTSPSTSWNGMFNSNAALDDDADWYIGPYGNLGHGELGTTAYHAIHYGQWHRVGLVHDRLNNRVKYWVDGNKVLEGPASSTDRYLLWASDHAGADLIFQGDHSDLSPPINYTTDICLSSFALSDFAYSDHQMQSFGGPSAAGIPLPEVLDVPGTLTEFASPSELDLAGDFCYAINVGGAAARTISGLEFQPGLPGITGYQNTMSPGSYDGARPDFGDDADINSLEDILETITYHDAQHGGSQAEVRLDVTAGETYKLQLLFWKAVCARTFDVSIEGRLVLDEFNPAPPDEDIALLYTYEFTAEDDQLNILFEAGTSLYETHHPILDALTLEKISTIPGDTNDDGRVDQTDAATLAAHWGRSGGWSEGDFDGDGLVGPADAAILAAHWGYGTGEETGPTVPEPSCVLMLLSLLLAAGRRSTQWGCNLLCRTP